MRVADSDLSDIETIHGYPVATAANVYDVVECLGISSWEQVEKPLQLEDYLKRDLNRAQRDELKFLPKTEVDLMRTPNGEPYAQFVTVARDWAMVIAPVPDPTCPGDYLIPLVAEYKSGGDRVAIALPAGTIRGSEKGLPNAFELAGKREFEEEFGIELASVRSLKPGGIPIACRNNRAKHHPIFGKVRQPIVRAKSKLDETEFMAGFFMRLPEWLKHLKNNPIDEDSNGIITLLALMHLDRL